MDELPLAQLAEFIRRQFLALFLQVVPEFQKAHKVGVRLEARVHFVGLLLFFQGPLAHVLDGQGGDDDRNGLDDVVRMPGRQHAREPRIGRDARHVAADGGKCCVLC